MNLDEPKRSTKDGPFCWQSKDALRLIRDVFHSTGNAGSVASALAVYLAFTELESNSQDDLITASHKFIGSLAGLSRATVKRILKTLEEKGLVKIKQNFIPGSKGLDSSTYVLLPLAHDEPTLAHDELVIKKRKKYKEKDILAIYEVYPRKVGKPKAVKAIEKALKEVSFKTLLEKTKAYAEARKGEDSRYTPYPATWFNEERYNDDKSTWAPKPKGKKDEQVTAITAGGTEFDNVDPARAGELA